MMFGINGFDELSGTFNRVVIMAVVVQEMTT
jgi:hypothetical protein